MTLPLSSEEEDLSGEVIAEPGGVEFAKPEKPSEEGEAATTKTVEEFEEVGLYHPVVPELLEAFTDAVEILEKLAEGELTPSEAKAYYVEKVKASVEAVAIDTTKKEAKKSKSTRSRSSKSRQRKSSTKKKKKS